MSATLLRLKAVMACTGLSRSSIYASIQQRTFPRPVKIGPRAVGWVDSEIHEWIGKRIEASRAKDRR